MCKRCVLIWDIIIIMLLLLLLETISKGFVSNQRVLITCNELIIIFLALHLHTSFDDLEVCSRLQWCQKGQDEHCVLTGEVMVWLHSQFGWWTRPRVICFFWFWCGCKGVNEFPGECLNCFLKCWFKFGSSYSAWCWPALNLASSYQFRCPGHVSQGVTRVWQRKLFSCFQEIQMCSPLV